TGITYEHQGGVIEVRPHAKQSVEEAGRVGIEDLRHAQQQKRGQCGQEGRPESGLFASLQVQHQRRVRYRRQEVLGEEDVHVVAHVLADQVLEEQQHKKEIDAFSPV